jgi:hypothetical protein
MIIDPKSVSFKEIREDLLSYIESQPDSDKWSIFFQSTAGSNIVDFLSGLAAFLKMEVITARRENFIQFSKNRSSIIGHGQALGYSAYRGRNKRLSVTIVPSTTGVIYKYSYIGAVRDRYLVVEKDTVVNAGVPVSIDVIVGEVEEQTKIAPNTSLNSFRFTKPNVSQDCLIYIDDVEIPWSDSVEGMLDAKFNLQSNSYGSVDAKYLNSGTFQKRYMSGSEIKLRWVSLKNIDFADEEVKLFEENGTMTGLSTLSLFEDVEDATSIIVNAPLKNETANAVRGREDQPKIFRSLHPDILDAQGEDVSSAIMKIFVLREGFTAFTPTEKLAMQKAFEPKRPHGLLPPIIEDAEICPITLAVNVLLKKNSTTTPQPLVSGIIDNYRNKLAGAIVLSDIEEAIEDDDGVKIARVSVKADARSSSTKYRLGQYISKPTPNGKVYRVKSILSRSGTTEPSWNITEQNIIDGTKTLDNEIVWKPVAKTDLAGISAWNSSTSYGVGSVVKPSSDNGFVFECVDVTFHSDSVEPIWPVLEGSEVYDGRLIWKARPIEGSVSEWLASTGYKKGDVVKQTTGTATLMFQCVGHLGKSGSSAPTYPTTVDSTMNDGDLVWLTIDPLADTHEIGKNQHFDITIDLTVE